MAEPERPDHIRFKLKWIADHADSLGESDLEWAERMEDAFKRNGRLTERQSEVLDRLYRKAE